MLLETLFRAAHILTVITGTLYQLLNHLRQNPRVQSCIVFLAITEAAIFPVAHLFSLTQFLLEKPLANLGQ